MKGFPTSADIYLELDGRKIAVVQSYRAKAAKSSKNIKSLLSSILNNFVYCLILS